MSFQSYLGFDDGLTEVSGGAIDMTNLPVPVGAATRRRGGRWLCAPRALRDRVNHPIAKKRSSFKRLCAPD
ncbi:hypothetical protein GCM10010994_08990 [Chelatococcus reniformis]|uniref:Uncharacterized protein n=1 Tax=Chelatococcus reniformis TaxID=1494448 RepID=A0A916U0W2_9HYPH|nr:hypothetical protein GCM10010994_08990 [Chelatococcus reniformis]